MRLLWMVALAAAKPSRENQDFRPVGSAAEFPQLESLIQGSGWTPSPTLSGVYAAGRVFEQTPSGLQPYSDSCIERAKKLVFGAPEQHTIPADSLAPSAACEAKPGALSNTDWPAAC